MSIGSIIRRKRVSHGISQVKLAERLGYRSGQFIYNWERGESLPPIERLAMLVIMFKLNKKEILTQYIEEIAASRVKEYNQVFKNKTYHDLNAEL